MSTPHDRLASLDRALGVLGTLDEGAGIRDSEAMLLEADDSGEDFGVTTEPITDRKLEKKPAVQETLQEASGDSEEVEDSKVTGNECASELALVLERKLGEELAMGGTFEFDQPKLQKLLLTAYETPDNALRRSNRRYVAIPIPLP
jgi:hypothetical protein